MTIKDLTLKSVHTVNTRTVLLKLTDSAPLASDIRPGQFVEVRVDGSPATFLRRPISICFVDHDANELWLLVAMVGSGTRRLAQLKPGDTVNCVLPLGNGFTLPATGATLLIGGGVGVAPLLYAGQTIAARAKDNGELCTPTFLLGARTKDDLLLLDEFSKYGTVYVTTEDGSMGERGFVTHHPVLLTTPGTAAPAQTGASPVGSALTILTCGPTPMMKAVARYAHDKGIDCQASLENMMACGLGACLCCVEKTTRGNLCVCKDGPVFNTKELLWQI